MWPLIFLSPTDEDAIPMADRVAVREKREEKGKGELRRRRGEEEPNGEWAGERPIGLRRRRTESSKNVRV